MNVRRLARGSLLISIAAVSLTASLPDPPANAVINGFAASSGGRSLVPALVRTFGDQGIRDVNPVRCSATLIAPRWVLTAQHCTNIAEQQGRPYSRGQITVSLDKSVSSSRIGVSRILRMDGYNSRTLANDVALLELTRPVTNVAPVRLADQPVPVGRHAYVYGFGETGVGRGDFGTLPRVAEVQVKSGSQTHCAVSQPTADMTFGTSVRGGNARGDSGGPMLEWSNGVPTLFAVTAGDIDDLSCSHSNLVSRPADWLGIYNRVDRQGAAFLLFIRKYVPTSVGH